MALVFKTPGVYVEKIVSVGGVIEGVATGNTVLLGRTVKGPYYKAVRLQGFADYEHTFGKLQATAELGYAVSQFFANGGQQLWVMRVPAIPSAEQWSRALAALDAVEMINLLALPGASATAVITQAHAYAVKRRAFLLIDPPAAALTISDILAFRASLPTSMGANAAVYFPWIKINDPLAPASLRLCAPSGSMAGVIARTDETRGVWKAPAGPEAILNQVADLAVRLTDEQNGVFNPKAVNSLRMFPKGIIAWGARTLAGNDDQSSEWKYIPVRRLGLYIEASLDRGLKWMTPEPNAEPLWAKIRLSAGNFLNGLFRLGAFQGVKSEQAYFVKCDATTMTSVGTCRVLIGFAPLKPAEFIVLTLSLKMTGG